MRGLWKPACTFAAIALAVAMPPVMADAQGATVLGLVMLATTVPFTVLYVTVASLQLARFRRGLEEAGLGFHVVEDEVGWLGARRQTLHSDRGTWALEAELHRSGTTFLVTPPGHHEPLSITDDKRKTARRMAQRTLAGEDPVPPAEPARPGPVARKVAAWVRHHRVLFGLGMWTLFATLHVVGAWARSSGAAPPVIVGAAHWIGLGGAGVFGLFASLLLLRPFYSEAELQARTAELIGPTFALGLGGLTLGAAITQGLGAWVSGLGTVPVVPLALGVGAVVGGVVSALQEGFARRMAGTAAAVLGGMACIGLEGRVLFVPLGVTVAVLTVVTLWRSGAGAEDATASAGSAGR